MDQINAIQTHKAEKEQGVQVCGVAVIVNGLERLHQEGDSSVKEGVSHAHNYRKSILGRGNSECKGPEAECEQHAK